MNELGKQRFQRIMKRIKKNPGSWNQEVYHCGSAHCVAGHAELDFLKSEKNTLALKRVREGMFTPYRTFHRAKKWLGLTEEEADGLFGFSNTIEDLERIGKEIYG